MPSSAKKIVIHERRVFYMAEKTLFQGNSITCSREHDIANVQFNNQKSSVNKFDAATLEELRSSIDQVQKEKGLKGLVLTSSKDAFMVGADITEFLSFFKKKNVEPWLEKTHKLFNDIEDLPFPTVSAIHGFCLGGGCEVVLSTCFRIATPQAKVGLPETKLGIIPGWGGCIRLPRLIGVDNAVEWIASGQTWDSKEALKVGAIDAIVDVQQLLPAAYKLIEQAHSGKLTWEKRRFTKTSPLRFKSPIEKQMAIETSKAFVGAQAGKHYPAPLEAISVIEKTADMNRDQALAVERKIFAGLTQTNCAESLISIFLSDQYNKKHVKSYTQKAKPVKRAAVLGAGIMGGGIAYQSASRGVPILMKDIQIDALEKGLGEARQLLMKQMERKKLDAMGMARTLSAITPTLSYGDFQTVDLVIEAVVENEGIKRNVLSELSKQVRKGTVLASNTSTLAIDKLASATTEPENFCGMHFFNPVHRMPLVEVIRGSKTSEETIGTVVQYALQMGKIPVVVKDCPGFLVNRILFPYLWGFFSLVVEGVHPYEIDKVMERFGWPMGPAYLLDVIGIDTASHAQHIMNQGFPERMPLENPSILERMNKEKRLGQKTQVGFYRYSVDKKGRPQKNPDADLDNLLSSFLSKKEEKTTLTQEDIIDRMMIPLINESALCLMDGIVSSAQELDLALINGIGFPPFLGGALKYLDFFGFEHFTKRAQQFRHIGKAYEVPALIQEHTQTKRSFYN
jgi:3-hydroxyacyl-CoA dehydrogenase/enoyl-CoA hydratase/3-hydroxybutyryl-CoA epimerase/enoyl-CoA isomerase